MNAQLPDINKRLLDIVQFISNGNVTNFISKIKLSHQVVNRCFNIDKRNGKYPQPSTDIITAVSKQIDEINIDWLLTGSGEMLKTSNVVVMENSTSGVPYYENIDVSGGVIPMFNDSKEVPTFYINYPHFNDCTAYLPVVGDSMYPRYASGEIIAIKQVFNKDMIQWGEAYMIVGNSNTDFLRTVKLVYPHPDDSNKIILRASNPNFKGDTVINKEDIISLFLIKGKITRNQL